jgi:hypothetical protein
VYDPTDIKAQQRAARDEQERQRIAKENEAADYQWLLSTDRGRRMVWNWLGDYGVFRTSFNSSGSITAFNEGQRNAGLRLITAVMEHAPEMFPVMQAEAKKRES